MKTLVLADHDNKELKDATLAVVTAAAKLGDVTVLVAGSDCEAVADQAAKVAGVVNVLLAEDAAYAPYLARQDAEIRDLRASEAVGLGPRFPFAEVPGLSREMVERLEAAKPATLSAAGRIPGITPAALAALLVHARRAAQAA